MPRGKKTRLEEIEEGSETDMVGILELSDWEFKAAMINI